MRRQAFDLLAIGGTMEDIHCVLRSGDAGVSLDRTQRVLSLSTTEKHHAKTVHVSLGGNAANAAVASARLGLKTGLVSAVGKDPIGEELLRILKAERVDVSLITQVVLEETGVSIVLLDEASGEQTSIFTAGANRLLEITEDVQKTFHTTAWAYVTSLGDAQEDNLRFLLPTLEEEATRVAFVPSAGTVARGVAGVEKLLARTDVIVMTEHEARTFLGQTIGETRSLLVSLRALGPRIAVLTRGPEGAVIGAEREELVVEAPTASVVDTIGAGDAFATTFIAGLFLFHDDLGASAQAAALNAASVVGAATAQKGLLTRAGLLERLRQTPVAVTRA